MLPPKVVDFIKSLTVKTQNQEFKWDYNGLTNTVVLAEESFSITISYRFDEVRGLATFNVYYYTDSANPYIFNTTEEYSDYSVVSYLYDLAQSSEINFPF